MTSSASTGVDAPDDAEDDGEAGDEGCENAPLFYGPVTLPAATVGETYRVDVRDYAEDGWWGHAYFASSPLGDGLSFDEDTVEVFGVPEAPAFIEFTIEAEWGDPDDECSDHPDPHDFDLPVQAATDSDSGSGSDSGSDSAASNKGQPANHPASTPSPAPGMQRSPRRR